MIIEGNKIVPDNGKWLYNGKFCSGLVYLGKNASADDWQETGHYIDPVEDAMPAEEDYIQSLKELGVLEND